MFCCSNSNNIQYFINDPSTKDLMIDVIPPEKTHLQLKVKNYRGGGQKPGSVAAQAANCYVTLANCMNYILSRSEKEINKWAGGDILTVHPRAGKEFNAYYDRKNLKFFYGYDPEYKKYIFTSESADVVAHELGHAILDAIRPDMWNVQSLEVWAFHEAFGDCTAILNILQYDQILDIAVQTDLKKSNLVSRLAEEMARALYHVTKGKGGLNINALRDATDPFVYEDPTRLPERGPDSSLVREPHSFGRIFSGAFYEILIEIFLHHAAQGMDKKTALKTARDVMCLYLMQAVARMPLTRNLFNAVAKQIIHADSQNNKKYSDILIRVFKDRKILKKQIMLLNNETPESIIKKHKNIIAHDSTNLHITRKRNIKISDCQVSALAYTSNPFYDLEVETASEEAFLFNENGYLTEHLCSTEDEIIEDVKICLDFLNNLDLVSRKTDTPFAVSGNKLVRTQIYCGCIKNNSCIPGAPEYQKGWKPENNAGCGKGKKIDCDCGPKPIATTKQKLGCYITINAQGSSGYRVGQRISRTVC